TTTEATTTTTTTTESTTTTTTAPNFSKVIGDADGDEMIGIVDVIIVQKYLLGAEKLDKQSKVNVDLTNDGQVNAFDLAVLKRMLLNV
ncbi:MAG: dockerin type I repeat-containing protein, partial [Oscillospiraceae bacterium]|nr:dockerin type I repeat-containing protein [Oscillospiraceae bacterium]